MSWGKVLGAGVVAGIVANIVDFVMHGIIMAETYKKYPEVFTQEGSNPIWFLVISVCIFIVFAIIFAKTRQCWAAGLKGGAIFGFWIGLIAFFSFFYDTLVLEGYPYYLAWCQGGIAVISAVVGGAVVGAIIKS